MDLVFILVLVAAIVAGIYFWQRHTLYGRIKLHFWPIKHDRLTISVRQFPFRVRGDLQREVDRLVQADCQVDYFCGVQKQIYEDLSLSDLMRAKLPPAPPQYEDIDIGEEKPVRCLKSGLWLLRCEGLRLAILVSPQTICGRTTGMQIEVAVPTGEPGIRLSQKIASQLEAAVNRAESYRGKILSFEEADMYSGESRGIRVHRLRKVEREQVILPRKTLDLLDRNVVQFVAQRARLAQFHQATKKGLLFYGPPGTGKTHTIHYLMTAMAGHTTLLVTAEQVGHLAEYMTLARLLQPSIVVIEDVDLIARDRASLDVCQESLLNKLLNEMDGLREDAEILFVLTTNRPEALEAALASRPGRVDQAIEFPLPDAEGRSKLVALYSQGVPLAEGVVETIVNRTEKVSAAFIKELMRRSVQFHLLSNGTGQIQAADVEQALDEMLVSGGSLNLKLLGAASVIVFTGEPRFARHSVQ